MNDILIQPASRRTKYIVGIDIIRTSRKQMKRKKEERKKNEKAMRKKKKKRRENETQGRIFT